MSFPVPVKYNLTDDKNETVVVYNDGREERLLPDPGCFSQENINKFANRWISGNLGEKVVISATPDRQRAFAGSPFETVLYTPENAAAALFRYSSIRVFVSTALRIIYQDMFSESQLTVIDTTATAMQNYALYGTPVNKVILRYNSVVRLNAPNNFTRSPFDADGSGGEIYIPKNLYDHLGDGSELDYKVAANWSTLDGYGTITWRQIEGSEYEFNYADGTPIGSV